MFEIPAELAELMATWQFEENGIFCTDRFIWENCNFKLRFYAHDGEGAFDSLHYELTASKCAGVVDVSQCWSRFTLFNEHVSLLDLNEPRRQLMFSGPCANAAELSPALLEHHTRLYGEWVNVNDWLNGANTEALTRLLTNVDGMLARGPICVLEGFEKVAADHAVSVYYTGEPRTRPGPRHQMLEIGNGWLIANDFAMRRLDNEGKRIWGPAEGV